MKTHRISIYTRIALIAAAASVMTACVSNPHYYDRYPHASTRVVYYDYWYYPAIGAYYDPRARIYIYHEHDHWIRTRALPPRMRSHLGHHVTVRSPHDRPYEEHHRHRQQYQPERHREWDRSHNDDAWIGTPRQPSHQYDRDVRRTEDHDRDRNGRDRRHEPDHGTVYVPPLYREPDVKYPRHTPDTRRNDTSRHREPPAGTTRIKRDDKRRQPEVHREKSREELHSGNTRRNNDRKSNHGRSETRTGQSGQYRGPDSRGQTHRTPPQAAQGHREPPTITAPTQRNDKGHQRENRNEDSRHRYREGDDRQGNVNHEDSADSRKRQRIPYDRYEHYR